MKTLVLLLASCWCLSFSLANQHESSEAQSLRVIPTPQNVQIRSGAYRITSQTRIVLGEGTKADDAWAAEHIVKGVEELRGREQNVVKESALRRMSANYVYIGTPRSEFGAEQLRARGGRMSSAMREEGYFLDANTNGVVILAESPRGRFYGAMTLLQIIERQRRSVLVPAVSVHDWPVQKIRGITDDISRGQISTLDNFKKIIRFLSHYKLNTYALYMEDVFTFRKHPPIGKSRGALTAAEVKELDAYARQHHVELIPIFQTLGHWENILLLPEYAVYAEFPGAHTLNVSDGRTYRLLDELIGEVAQAFSSPYVHIGADESWDVGKGASMQRVAASDIATVHANHYKRVFEILRKYRKKPMLYGDMLLKHPAVIPQLPKDVIVMDWQYHAAETYASAETFKMSGVPFVVSPAVMNFTGPFPDYLNTFVNVRAFNRSGYRNGSLGVLTSNWNDFGGEALRELNFWGYAWTAECAWQPDPPLADGRTEFNRKFFSEFFGVNNPADAIAVYHLLSQPFNRYTWHELWRHPMLPPQSGASSMNYLVRVESIESTMPLVQSLLAELKKQATQNHDQVAHLEFISRLNLWFAKKLTMGKRVRTMMSSSTTVNRDSIQRAALQLMSGVVPELQSLKEEFARLWKQSNREAGLELLLQRYDRQAAYWNETIEQIRRGDAQIDPRIPSEWIYHGLTNPRAQDTAAAQVPRAYFRYTLELHEQPSAAMVQLIGDTHARLWVNETEVGEVAARPSLSLIVEHQRVKAWDVSRYLRAGKNIVAVEVANYDEPGSAGFNLYGELTFRDGTTRTLLSDSTWTVSPHLQQGWNGLAFDDRGWEYAAAKQFPLPVVRPNFASGRLSWIER